MRKTKLSKRMICMVLTIALLVAQTVVSLALTSESELEAMFDAEISVIEHGDKTIYDIHEDEKHDILIVKDNGEMILNGNNIKVTVDTIYHNQDVAPYATYTTVIDAPPRGTLASDYNDLFMTKTARVEMEKSLAYQSQASVFVMFQTVLDATGIWYGDEV